MIAENARCVKLLGCASLEYMPLLVLETFFFSFPYYILQDFQPSYDSQGVPLSQDLKEFLA
jgi:hypothetical protein